MNVKELMFNTINKTFQLSIKDQKQNKQQHENHDKILYGIYFNIPQTLNYIVYNAMHNRDKIGFNVYPKLKKFNDSFK